MKTPLLAIDVKVQCSDGSVHDGLKMYLRDGQKVFFNENDQEIANVETIHQATAVMPPTMLVALLQKHQEVNNG